MITLDEKNGENGCDLEELIAHRFLEKRGVSTRTFGRLSVISLIYISVIDSART